MVALAATGTWYVWYEFIERRAVPQSEPGCDAVEGSPLGRLHLFNIGATTFERSNHGTTDARAFGKGGCRQVVLFAQLADDVTNVPGSQHHQMISPVLGERCRRISGRWQVVTVSRAMYRACSKDAASQQRYNLHDMTLRIWTGWCCIAVVVVILIPSASLGQDWPQWRGVNRDGGASSFDRPQTWPESLTKQWVVDVGLGYASPLIVGNRVYVFARQGDDEVMMCLDPQTGEQIWRTAYPVPFTMNPATARHLEGPKSTPTYADGRIFSFGISGILTAFDADTGRELWQYPAWPVEPLYHTSMSPLVDGDLMILHVGGHDDGALTAFDVATGDIRWTWTGDGPAYGSPMIVEFERERQVVTFTQEHFVGVSAETGALLWQRPFTTRSTTTSQTPLFFGDTVIQAGRGNGITAFRVLREGNAWETEDVWHTDEVSLHMANAVVTEGVLFGLSHLNSGQYFGLDLTTGTVLWTSAPRQASHASIVRAGNTIFSLEDDAELLVLEHNRTSFAPIKRYDVGENETWSQPLVSGNRLFVKDVSALALWTID